MYDCLSALFVLIMAAMLLAIGQGAGDCLSALRRGLRRQAPSPADRIWVTPARAKL